MGFHEFLMNFYKTEGSSHNIRFLRAFRALFYYLHVDRIHPHGVLSEYGLIPRKRFEQH